MKKKKKQTTNAHPESRGKKSSPKRITRMSLGDALEKKGRSDFKKIESTSDDEIAKQIAADPDLYELTDGEIKEFKRVHKKNGN